MHESRHLQHGVNTGFINIVADSYYLPAYWAHPLGGGSFPGLVLLHEWWGLNSNIRTQARRLAEMGFYVIVPDLFNGYTATTPEQAIALLEQFRVHGLLYANAAVNALRTHNHCNGHIGVIGWQMGGELAYQVTLHQTNLRAIISFYGQPDAFLAALETVPADVTPILAFYGDADPMTPLASIERLRRVLEDKPTPCEVVIYPGATIGFFNETISTYAPEYADDAWRRMLAFLGEHLELPAADTTV